MSVTYASKELPSSPEVTSRLFNLPYNIVMDISKHLNRDGIGSLLRAYPHFTFLIPLFEAATQKGSGKVGPKMLLEPGMPAMCWVAKHGSHALVQILLDNGVNPTVQDQHGSTPLHHAIYTRDLLMVYHLLYRGANANINDAYNKQGMAALHCAAWQNGTERIVKYLLKYGAEINKLSLGHGQTALHYAAQFNNIDVVRILCYSGASTSIRCRNGFTPLFWGVHFRAGYGDPIAVTRLLLDGGARINAVDAEGNTALHVAALGEFPECVDLVRLLLKNGADVSMKNKHGQRVLDVAAGRKEKDVKLIYFLCSYINGLQHTTRKGKGN